VNGKWAARAVLHPGGRLFRVRVNKPLSLRDLARPPRAVGGRKGGDSARRAELARYDRIDLIRSILPGMIGSNYRYVGYPYVNKLDFVERSTYLCVNCPF
jgi:hypothetical protein